LAGPAAGNAGDVESLNAPTVQLRLESRPESVALVRAMLSGANEQLSFGPELLADLKTAASEACNNVVMHAYPFGNGQMLVTLAVHAALIEVTVADSGTGLGELPGEDHFGVGLAVIKALAADAEVDSVPGRGTTVRMVFARRQADRIGPTRADIIGALEPVSQIAGEVVVTVAPVQLLAAILGRVAGCVAAGAHFSIDRYSDLYLVTDGIAAHARTHASADRISAGLAARPRQIELTVGPLRAGTAVELAPVAAAASPRLLTLLVDKVAVESIEESEAIRLMLFDKPAGQAGSA
jgi:anti-sigma regulatory factor (Ser/Thr protein kinase)